MPLNESIKIGMERIIETTVADYSINIWMGIFALIGIFTVFYKLGSMIPQFIMFIAYIHGGVKWIYNKIRGRWV